MFPAFPIAFNEIRLHERVKEVAQAISKDYAGKELIMIGVLKGAVFFVADLIRHISVPLKLDFISIAPYDREDPEPKVVKIMKDLEENIQGKEVLLVEDFVDTGLTLHYLIEILQLRKPAGIKICTLLDKPGRRKIKVPIDYRGFEVANDYLIGYGMDKEENWRNLPYIAIWDENL
jgi:hypoxanthine phosphoribosyltransferase